MLKYRFTKNERLAYMQGNTCPTILIQNCYVLSVLHNVKVLIVFPFCLRESGKVGKYPHSFLPT